MNYRLLLPLLFPVLLQGQSGSSTIAIMPEPVSVIPESSVFHLSERTKILYPTGHDDWRTCAQYLQGIIVAATGLKVPYEEYGEAPKKMNSYTIQMLHDESIPGNEGYHMEVKESYISIRSKTAAGAFYALQTLRQLFPPEFFNAAPVSRESWTAPCCIIDDQPRFAYRGMHLDVGRHFFPVSFIKRYIDLLAMHKMNRFHWHLTDDQGWRIEIKKYPKLQTVASCRKETLVGHYSDQPQQFDGKPYCGYYTQDEIRDVVAYAQTRFVTIIPEIEMPGHALAALSAYPELGCTGGPYDAATKWGVFQDVFCAGNEQTFQFLDDVLQEVCHLFPSNYIHIGGDECPKDRWKNCPKCQKRMQDEGLKDENELQSYFVARIGKILDKYGKKMIGWDEILEGGLAPDATVMSWRGTDGGIAAAKAGHDAIMTPGAYCYFDHYQSNPETEPLAIGGYLPLEKVYGYEPIPAELTPDEAKHILGVQANLWTEYIDSPEKLEYMAYPRAIALAEVMWSPRALREWTGFAGRLKQHFKRLDVLKVNYSHAFFDIKSAFSDGKITLKAIDPALEIHYTLDGKEPDATSPLYTAPFVLTNSATVKAAAFTGAEKMGKTMSESFQIHKASGKPYTMSHKPEQYNGGEMYALTNGASGTLKTWDKWVGLTGADIDPVIDLGADMEIDAVTTHFVNSKVSWIYGPKRIEVFVSHDGKKFRSVAHQDFDVNAMSGISVETVQLRTPKAHGRYLKLVATNIGKIPDDQPGAGNDAWLFLDEIIVQ